MPDSAKECGQYRDRRKFDNLDEALVRAFLVDEFGLDDNLNPVCDEYLRRVAKRLLAAIESRNRLQTSRIPVTMFVRHRIERLVCRGRTRLIVLLY